MAAGGRPPDWRPTPLRAREAREQGASAARRAARRRCRLACEAALRRALDGRDGRPGSCGSRQPADAAVGHTAAEAAPRHDTLICKYIVIEVPSLPDSDVLQSQFDDSCTYQIDAGVPGEVHDGFMYHDGAMYHDGCKYHDRSQYLDGVMYHDGFKVHDGCRYYDGLQYHSGHCTNLDLPLVLGGGQRYDGHDGDRHDLGYTDKEFSGSSGEVARLGSPLEPSREHPWVGARGR